MDYWKTKVLPKIKVVFAKGGNAKKAAAAELIKSFDESKVRRRRRRRRLIRLVDRSGWLRWDADDCGGGGAGGDQRRVRGEEGWPPAQGRRDLRGCSCAAQGKYNSETNHTPTVSSVLLIQ